MNENELMHYGVKGMKWRVRRAVDGAHMVGGNVAQKLTEDINRKKKKKNFRNSVLKNGVYKIGESMAYKVGTLAAHQKYKKDKKFTDAMTRSRKKVANGLKYAVKSNGSKSRRNSDYHPSKKRSK